MQQFRYTIKKVKDSESYEFLFANKKYLVDDEVFRKILDICPRIKGEEFTKVQDDDATLTFLIDISYKAIINKCLFEKTASNDRLRKSKIDILCGIFNRENVDYPELIWKDFAFQIDHKKERKSRRKTMSFPRFTKVIINHFLSQHNSLSKLKFQHYHIIKDNGTGGSSKGTGRIPRILDESIVVFATSSEGTGEEQVTNNEDEELSNAEVEESWNGNEENTDAAKEDVEKIKKVKDDAKKAKLPLTSSSLSVSLGFGDQFLKLYFDTSLIVAPVTTLPPHFVSTIPPIPHQTTTLISTPPITTDAPIITTIILESDALSTVQLRVLKLEKDVFELKKIDHSAKALATLKSQVPLVEHYVKPAPALTKIQTSTVDLKQESKKSPSEIRKIEKEQVENTLYHTMLENKSFNRYPTNHAIYHALMEALIEDENAMDKEVVDIIKNHKIQHDNDDDDEDPSTGPNQGKKTKKKRTKESKLSKNHPPPRKPLKVKLYQKVLKLISLQLQRNWEEPIAEVVMDDAINTVGKDVVCNDDQPQDTSEPKKNKTPNLEWFKQPPRPSTPELEWNKRQNNPERDCYPFDLSKPLPLQCDPNHLTVIADYFFNNNLDYLKAFNSEKTYTTSITKTKAARYEIVGIEDMTLTLWSSIKHAYDKDAGKGIKH
uniref:Uncharacterized protein n=1 Tax=Tanacetum cinerariifolium TaxID=118510 RepID=A0A699H6K3_TANCI|nr:hypothetical protein [Tanacetum cinerariifolium]